MTRRTIRLTMALTLAVLFATPPRENAGAEEIVVAVPPPAERVELPGGKQAARLSSAAWQQAKMAAQRAWKQAKSEGREAPVVIQLPAGLLLLNEPIELGPEDSGDAPRPIIWQGSSQGGTQLSGGILLTQWKKMGPGVVQTTLPEVAAGDWHFRTIWSAQDGPQPVRCRWPKSGYFHVDKAGEDRRTQFTWQGDDLKTVQDLANVELVFLHDWSITRCPVQTLDAATRMLRVPRQIGCELSFFNIDNWEPHARYLLENAREFLTEPGEWHLDQATGKLTYRLRDGERAESLVLVAPRAEGVLRITGSAGSPVRHLHVQHLQCGYTNAPAERERTYWGIQATWHHEPKSDEKGFVNVAPADGCVHLSYADQCRLDHVIIQNVGATGLSLGRGVTDCSLRNSAVNNCGGNGITIGTVDQRDPARNATVDRCRITRAGQVFYGAVGIWIGFTQNTTVSHSTITQMPYSGISCGWLWSPQPTVARAQSIVNNEIGHCMQILSDGGGIYTLGCQPDSILAGNLIHDIPLNAGRAESNGMFLDEGTKGFTIRDNFIYATDKSPLRFHRAETNLVERNFLIVPNAETPMIRYNNTPEENITVTDNVTNVDDLDKAIDTWRRIVARLSGS